MRHGFDALVDTLIDLECEQKNNLNFIYLFILFFSFLAILVHQMLPQVPI